MLRSFCQFHVQQEHKSIIFHWMNIFFRLESSFIKIALNQWDGRQIENRWQFTHENQADQSVAAPGTSNEITNHQTDDLNLSMRRFDIHIHS